ncbi:CBS and ACT domain-containing protein [Desulforhopalus singaporensis]|uniref:Acetoin utilization protein AcuB n=1 Tax=Desulforhopalus singaporensis TaxID=91360 RepID=A0A1H0MLC8_9BACT|nr:CBS and ACT domain-containing protein [Desulforhopalus singaporensis]SDO81076.1 acetoin utilization protein AcuB [Desulforhopalus singaporensis]
MFVKERMATGLVTVGPEMKILEARQLMIEKNIRHLPVVDDAGQLLGLVSDRDMRDAMPSRLLEPQDYKNSLEKIGNNTVSDIMTVDLLRIFPYYTIQDTLLLMQKKKVGAFPVVNDEGTLQGIMSTRDLLKAFVNVLNIDEPGSLLCIVVENKPGQMKKIVDVITEENISLGSVLVARYWEKGKRAVFPYLLTNNVITVKKRLQGLGFEMIDPMQWYIDQLPS